MKLIKGLISHPTGRIGMTIVVAIAFIAALAPLVAPYDPYDLFDRDMPRLAPSSDHLLGTDHAVRAYRFAANRHATPRNAAADADTRASVDALARRLLENAPTGASLASALTGREPETSDVPESDPTPARPDRGRPSDDPSRSVATLDVA